MKHIIPVVFIIFMFSVVMITNTTVTLDDTIQNQIQGHYAMNEIYVHYYAGILNFLLSAASAWIIVSATKRSKMSGWTYIAWGIFFTGIVGFGEFSEHLFNPIWHDFFHYIHIYAGLLGISLLYLGTRSIVISIRGSHSTEKRQVILFFILALVLLSLLTSIKTTRKWDPVFEIPVISFLFVPTLFLTLALLYDATKIFQESGFTMVSLSIFALSAMLLNLVIILGRIADIQGNMYAYIITHGIQDLLHVVTSTTALIVSVTLYIALKKIETIRSLIDL